MNRARWAFGALLLHSALIQGITFLLRPATTYQALELDVPVAAIGAIAAAFALVPLALAIPAGALVDRLGARTVLVTGSLLTVAASAGLLFAGGTVVGLVISTGLLGAGHLGCIVGQQSIGWFPATIATRTT
jgi:MFS family permease